MSPTDAAAFAGPDALMTRSVRSLIALAPALSRSQGYAVDTAPVLEAARRGYFTPDEEDVLRSRFAIYLNARAALLETLRDLRPLALGRNALPDPAAQVRAFLVAYTAASVLMRAGRFLVKRFAHNPVARDKLDEAEPRFRIPSKQFARIYRSLTDPRNVLALRAATRFADEHRDEIAALRDDAALGPVCTLLSRAEGPMRSILAELPRHRLRYRLLSLRRRPVSAWRHVLFGLLAVSGSAVARFRNPWHRRRLGAAERSRLAALLRPGDVIVTRRDDALTNLFLPGFWPHAALHVGSRQSLAGAAVEVDPDRAGRWIEPLRVLEARKDGVLLRAIDDTLDVDCVAVMRPRLGHADLAHILSRALTHEGKLYDFVFDFGRADRLVCTEVVYRAYHGVGGIAISPRLRAGRWTVSAEDLLDLAVEDRGFEPLAVFGAPPRPREIVTGPQARDVLAASYRKERPWTTPTEAT